MNTYKDQFRAWAPGELTLRPSEMAYALDWQKLNTSLMYMDRDIKRLMIISAR